MTTKIIQEETLSDKITETDYPNPIEFIKLEYVKDFIKKLNKIARNNGQLNGLNFVHIKDINKLAGEKLI